MTAEVGGQSPSGERSTPGVEQQQMASSAGMLTFPRNNQRSIVNLGTRSSYHESRRKGDQDTGGEWSSQPPRSRKEASHVSSAPT